MQHLKQLYHKKWFAYVEIAALLCLAALFLWNLYGNDPSGGWYKCPVNYVTGIKCMGCGYTHALRSLMHGSLLQAHRENLMVLPYTAMLLTLGGRYIRHRLFHGKAVFAMKAWPFALILSAGLLYMVLRNIFPI